MFLVGGGILVHGIAPLHHAIDGVAQGFGAVGQVVLPALADGLVGVVAGALVLAGLTLGRKLLGRPAPA
jgi:predicted DNA repair protein MutK